MQARYYDPVTARFLSNDPVWFTPGTPQMFNRYAYVLNDPVNMVDPNGEIAIYVKLEAAFQVGGFGGRISVGGGVDLKKRTLFLFESSGGSMSDFAHVSNEGNGLQFGLGAGGGIAESSDFVVAPAFTTDFDAAIASISVAANNPVIDADGRIADPTSSGRDGPTDDTRIRQAEISIGPGLGGSTIKTEGTKVEAPIPFIDRPQVDPCSEKNTC